MDTSFAFSGGCSDKPAAVLAFLPSLGLHGADHLAPAILAALADTSPLLLIGPPGCGKSMLLERLAQALQLRYRHYNASLVNFDEVFGFPVPNQDRTGIVHLRGADSIWDAQCVFIDELSRCRPEMANRFFSVIHERRIGGHPLPELQFRWSAMNPPPKPDGDEDHACLGALPLDAALADRFAWVLPMPAVGDMDAQTRLQLLRAARSAELRPVDVAELVAQTRHVAAAADEDREIADAWASALTVPLRDAGWPLTGRRMAMLASNAVWAWAAAQTLQTGGNRSDAFLLALLYGLPQRATGAEVDYAKVLAVHRAAYAEAQQPTTGPLRQLREIADPVQRAAVALGMAAQLDRATLGVLVDDAFAGLAADRQLLFARNVLAATDADCLPAHTYETLFAALGKVHSFAAAGVQHRNLPRHLAMRWGKALGHITRLQASGDPRQAELANILYYALAVAHIDCDAAALVADDANWAQWFGIAEEVER